MKKRTKQLATALLLGMATLATTTATLAQSTEKPYTYVEQMPVFKGGEAEMLKFLGQNINYPEDAVKDGTEGLVVLSFVVNRDGTLSGADIIKSLSTSTDAEALRVINMMDGKWNPGKQNGNAVPVRYTLPIRYAMKKEAPKPATPDRQPQFKGGQEALLRTIDQNLQFPEEAQKEHLNARVVVKFTVEPDGSVSKIKLENTKLKKTLGPGEKLDYMDAATFNLKNKAILAKLAEAAAAAVQQTSGLWLPAVKDGKPLAADVYLPIQFLGTEARQAQPSPSHNTRSSQEAGTQKPSIKDEAVHGTSALTGSEAATKKFFARHLRYPDTDAQGICLIKYEVLADGTVHYELKEKSDSQLQNEVLRVLKLAKEEGVLKYNGKEGLQSFAVKFMVKNNQPDATIANAAPFDVLVTKTR